MSADIITGDALQLIPTLADGSVPLVVTSPPYPEQYGNKMTSPEWLQWTHRWFDLLRPKMTANGVLVLNVQFKRTEHGWYDYLIFNLGHPGVTNFNILDVYIYGKSNPPPNGALTFCDPPGWEFVFILTNAARPQDVVFNPVRRPYSPKSIRKSNGTVYTTRNDAAAPRPDGARQTTLMIMSKSADQNRPNAKGMSFPRELPARFIQQYTNPGDLVLDPFCGVGTTVRMAAELGRRGLGFEIRPDEAARARAWLAEAIQPGLVAE